MLLTRCSGHPQSQRPGSQQHLGVGFVGLTRVPTVSSYGEPTTSRPWSETVGSAETSKKPVWKGSRKFPGWKAVTPLFANYPRGSNDGGDLSLPRRNRWSANCKTVRWSFLGTLRLRARDPCLSFAYRSAGLSHSPSRANDLIFHSRAIRMLGA